MSDFEIHAKDGLARVGSFTTKHGVLRTPLLMPVVHPRKTAILPKELIDTYGFQMLITNSYIIRSNDQFKTKAVKDGVHGLLGVEVPIMTDSGTFQMYFHDLPEGEINPIEIVEFQREIGTDIGTILDVFSPPNVGKNKVTEDVNVSLQRAKMSVAAKGDMMLAGTVQGGVYPDLRELSAKALAELDFDVYPIGGTVPLMENYRYSDVVTATLAAKRHLPLDRPVHLFGCGHPMFFAIAAALGCDFFDSASYAKFAESGRMLLTTGTVHLKDLRELPCDCPVCSRTTVDDLLNLEKDARELELMKHNLFVSAAEMRRVRQAIVDGKLLELAGIRARNHPALYDAFVALLQNYELIEELDPINKSSSIFYSGPETVLHPTLRRFQERILQRYPYTKTNTLVMIPTLADKPLIDVAPDIAREVRNQGAESILLVYVTPFGVVPSELEHVYPAQQCIFPSTLDEDTLQSTTARLSSFLRQVDFKSSFWLTRPNNVDGQFDSIRDSYGTERVEKSSEMLKLIESEETQSDWRVRKLNALLSYQWQVKSFDTDSLEIELSRSTGKIRFVRMENEIVFTLVPTTGLLAPTFKGGEMLIRQGFPEDYIVTVDSDATPFVAKGKSALAKFVINASPNLRAGEDVLLKSPEGEYLGVGRSVLSGREIMTFSRGVAVVTRHARK
jgi:7-cyano-7-deazaguanine tRNA-ribosyltransferase